MTNPAPDKKLDFTLTFRSETDAVSSGLFAYMTITRVHGHLTYGLMHINRHNGDLTQPIGLFAATLSRPQTAAVADAIDGINWGGLPRPVGGDINAANLSLDYAHGPRIIQRGFNARNLAFVQALSPVMAEIEKVDDTLFAAPERAIEVAATRTEGGFKLVIRNLGRGPVMIADPRHPGASPGTTRGSVNVAEQPKILPGTFAAPPVLRPVPLPPLGDAPPTVIIESGKVHEVETVAWDPPAAGAYMAQASWTDYVGPSVDPKTVLPLLPDPVQVADARPYVIRGAAFSTALKFNADKAKPRRR